MQGEKRPLLLLLLACWRLGLLLHQPQQPRQRCPQWRALLGRVLSWQQWGCQAPGSALQSAGAAMWQTPPPCPLAAQQALLQRALTAPAAPHRLHLPGCCPHHHHHHHQSAALLPSCWLLGWHSQSPPLQQGRRQPLPHWLLCARPGGASRPPGHQRQQQRRPRCRASGTPALASWPSPGWCGRRWYCCWRQRLGCWVLRGLQGWEAVSHWCLQQQ